MLYKNQTVNTCIIKWDSNCLKSILSNMKIIYNLNYIQIRYSNHSADIGKVSSCMDMDNFCYSMQDNVQYVCMQVC